MNYLNLTGIAHVHKAIREALANCIVNTDFYLPRGVVIRKEPDGIVMENPGSIRTGKKQMLKGGISDPRNKALMKMFNMIGIGERAGSGVPDIYSVWENEGWAPPQVVEEFAPDRTILKLSFRPARSKKTAEKSDRKKVTEKTQMQKELILSRMQPNKKYKVEEAAVWLAVGRTRARSLLKLLVEDGRITETGTTKMKRYQRLQEYEPAYTNWTNMPQSVKKTYTRAYLDAKTQAGQEKRIAWMVERLNKNLRPT